MTVHTGPHFAGRLSVEDDPSAACGLQGDPESERKEYVLKIDHDACRTQRTDTEVRTEEGARGGDTGLTAASERSFRAEIMIATIDTV